MIKKGGRKKLYNKPPLFIICNKCNGKKGSCEFYKEKRGSSGFQITCKECYKNYYKENIERYKKLKNSNKKYINKMREYYLKNKDNINSYKRTRYSTEEGRLKVLSVHHKRRANKVSTSDGSVTSKSLKILLKKQNYKCAISGKKLNEYDIDHIVPLNKNGKHTISNIQFVLPSINRSKKDKLLW